MIAWVDRYGCIIPPDLKPTTHSVVIRIPDGYEAVDFKVRPCGDGNRLHYRLEPIQPPPKEPEDIT